MRHELDTEKIIAAVKEYTEQIDSKIIDGVEYHKGDLIYISAKGLVLPADPFMILQDMIIVEIIIIDKLTLTNYSIFAKQLDDNIKYGGFKPTAGGCLWVRDSLLRGIYNG